MTRQFMKLPINAQDVVPDDTYTVEVINARPMQDKDLVWLDLKVLGGPDDGRVVSVSLNMPDDNASRGAQYYFHKKMTAFIPYCEHVWDLPNEEQAPALAEAVTGRRAIAKLSVQKEGQFKGSQQLDETQQSVEVEPARVPSNTNTSEPPF